MKKIFLAIITGITIFATSCDDIKFGNDFLEKPQSDEINLDTIFASKFLSDQVLAEVYKSLPDYLPSDKRLGWSVLETMSDLSEYTKASANIYQSGQVDATATGSGPYDLNPATDGVGSPIYGIRAAYTYIENVHKVKDMTDAEKAVRSAEAKLIIAFQYERMFRFLGGMPFMTHAFTPNDDMNMERLTVEEMVNKIVDLCDETAKVLPWSVSQENDGRMTAAAAKALKFRLLHFAASPLFNSAEPFMAGAAADKKYVWYGNYDAARWQRALDAGLDFLQSNAENGNFYKLVDDATKAPRDNFASAYFNRYNGEVLISSRRFTKYSTGLKSFAQVRFGVAAATLKLADIYELTDGTKFDWNNAYNKANPFFDNFNPATAAVNVPRRDPRLYETVLINGDKWQGRKAKVYTGGSEGPYSSTTYKNMALTGLPMRKFVRDFGPEVNNMFYQCPLMRLPEIYLGMAEIMNELGKANSKDKFGSDAYDYVNMVRNRVRMPGINSAKVAVGDALTDYILDERAREFAYEEVRYFDLTRRKRSDLMRSTNQILTVTLQTNGSYTYEPTAFTMHPQVWLEGGWSEKYFLIAIPQDEINKKYGLVQNPGW